MSAWDGSERIELVARRIDYVERLAEAPAEKPALTEALGHSRSTVDRAIRELEAAGLVERTDGGYVTTLTGRLAAERYRVFLAEEATILDARAALAPLAPDADLPAAVVAGGDVAAADGRPHRLFRDLAAPLEAAVRYRAVLPRLGDTRHLRLVRARAVAGSLDVDLVVSPALLDRLREEFPRLLAGLVDAGTVRVAETAPYGVVVLDGEDGDVAAVVTYEGGEPVGLIRNDAPAALAWAGERHADAVADADPVTAADLPAGPATAPPLGTDGPRDQGFLRVDADYFADRSPDAPATGWRVGFDLADVYYGQAFERHHRGDGERRPVADVLVERLRAGADQVVLGPPGSGKSTVCRTVACRWVEADHGPVFYRRAPGTRRIDHLGPLLSAIRGAEGHALVVVEDAAAAGVTSSVHEFLREVRDDPGVSVLLEAREHDWEAAGRTLSPRLRELRRTALSTYRLPRLDERECERAIATFEAATGRDVPLAPGELRERIRSESGAGESYLLGQQLTAHTDPASGTDAPTSLETDAGDAYDALAGANDGLVLDVGLLVAALTAAELEVDPALLHALATPDATDDDDGDRATDATGGHDRVERARERLAGRLTFGRAEDGVHYRTHHPLWAVAFLEHALETAERRTVAAFERTVSATFALADDPERRERIADWLGRSTPALERLGEDPDGFVEAFCDLATHHSSLAPLFGTPERSGIDLPAACSAATRLECSAARMRAWYGYGDFERAEAAAEHLRERAGTADVDAPTRARAVARAHHWLGMIADDRDDLEEAREQFEAGLEALRAAGVDDPDAEAGLYNATGWVLSQAGEYDAAREQFEAARERVGGEPGRRRSETLYYLGDLAWRRGDLEAAEEWLSASLSDDREVGDPGDEAATLNALGLVADDRGDTAAAVDYFRRSLERKRSVGDRPGEVATLVNLGYALIDQGDLDAAEGCLERAREGARDLGMERPEAGALGALGRLARERGDYGDAAAYHRRQREAHRDLDNDRGVAGATRSLGDLARECDDGEAAAERYREAYEAYVDVGAPGKAAETAERLIDLHADDDPEAAAAWCERAAALTADAGLDERHEAFERRRQELAASTGG